MPKVKIPELRDKQISLSEVKRGNFIKILHLPSGLVRTQMIRFGIIEGEIIKCLERLPGGTILIQKNRQEIAIGLELAKKIIVSKH
jgi:Fe2+ transport system protein FeoA